MGTIVDSERLLATSETEISFRNYRTSIQEVVTATMQLLRDNNSPTALHIALDVDTKSSWALTPTQPQTVAAQ